MINKAQDVRWLSLGSNQAESLCWSDSKWSVRVLDEAEDLVNPPSVR